MTASYSRATMTSDERRELAERITREGLRAGLTQKQIGDRIIRETSGMSQPQIEAARLRMYGRPTRPESCHAGPALTRLIRPRSRERAPRARRAERRTSRAGAAARGDPHEPEPALGRLLRWLASLLRGAR
jgi:hypothetical protein